MKPEPLKNGLKEKFKLLNLGYDIAQNSEKTTLKEKVKWLLQRIEERIEKLDKIAVKGAKERNYELADTLWLHVSGLLEARDLVKEAFKEVLEDETLD